MTTPTPVLCPDCGHDIDQHSTELVHVLPGGSYTTCPCDLLPSDIARRLIAPAHWILTTATGPECACGEAPPLGASAWRWIDQHIATQTIPHIHVHYVPRRPDDRLHLPWTDQRKDTP